MIVVAIIGILAAVAIPNFMNARDKARISAGTSAVHTIRTGLEMYMVDNDCYPFAIGAVVAGGTNLVNISNQITNAATILNNFQDTVLTAYTGTINAYAFSATCKDRTVRTLITATQDNIAIKEDTDSDGLLTDEVWVVK
ncbi:MAG: hypothetical protein ABIB46_00880 [bacterium]